MKQISLVSKNIPGIIAEISEALANQAINIESLDSESFGEHAVTILTVDQYDLALKILQQLPDMQAVTEDALLIRLEDKPGALANVALRFKQAGISMRSIRIVKRGHQESLVAISTDRTQEAMQLVQDMLIA